MAVETITGNEVDQEVAPRTAAPATGTRAAPKTMADFGLDADGIKEVMNDYAREFNAGGTPNLADILSKKTSKAGDLIEMAAQHPKTSKAIMEGTQAEKDEALVNTMRATFFNQDRGAEQVMEIVSKGLRKKIETPAPVVEAAAIEADTPAMTKENALSIVKSAEWKMNNFGTGIRVSMVTEGMNDEKKAEMKKALEALGYKSASERVSGTLGGNTMFVERGDAIDLLGELKKSGIEVEDLTPNAKAKAKAKTVEPEKAPEARIPDAAPEQEMPAELKTLGSYMPHGKPVAFGKPPKVQVGQAINQEGYGWHKPLQQRTEGYGKQREQATAQFKEQYGKLNGALEKLAKDREFLKDELDASRKWTNLGRGSKELRDMNKYAEKLEAATRARLDRLENDHERQQNSLARKEKISGIATSAVKGAGDFALMAKGAAVLLGDKLKAAGLRGEGVSETAKDDRKLDAGHSLLGSNINGKVAAAESVAIPVEQVNANPVSPIFSAKVDERRLDAGHATFGANINGQAPAAESAIIPIESKVNANPVSSIFKEQEAPKPSFWDKAREMVSGPAPITLGISHITPDQVSSPATSTPAAKPKGAPTPAR